MDAEKFKQAVRQGFDEASPGYDLPAMRFFDNSAEHLAAMAPLKGDESVLDAATGTGKVALRAAARLPRGRVLGVDLSPGMIGRAEAKARAAGLSNVTFHCEDIAATPLPERSYDGIFCGCGMFFFSDMEAVLGRFRRALKPGGFFAMSSFADGSFRPQSDLVLARFARYGAQLPESYTWQRLDAPAKHQALLEKAGLAVASIETRPMGYYLKDAEEWWDLVRFTGFRSFLNQLSPDNAARYKEEHLAEVQKTADPQGIRLNVDVIFSLARASS